MAKLPQQPLPRLGQGFRVPPAAGGGVAGRLAAVLEIQARVRRYIAHAALGHRQIHHQHRALARHNHRAVSPIAERNRLPHRIVGERPVARAAGIQVIHTVPHRRTDRTVRFERLAQQAEALRQHGLAVQIQVDH